VDPIYRELMEILLGRGVVAGTLTTIFIFYNKYIHTPTCKFCNSVRRFFTVGEKVEFVYNELKPNGGASVKDSIKRIEENIIVLMNKHRIIVDDYHTGILETDSEGNITWANSTYLEMTNRDLREVLGNGWINSVAEKDRQEVYRAWHEAFMQQRPFEGIFFIERPDGSLLRVKGFAYPIKGKERIQGYIGKIKIVVEEDPHA